MLTNGITKTLSVVMFRKYWAFLEFTIRRKEKPLSKILLSKRDKEKASRVRGYWLKTWREKLFNKRSLIKIVILIKKQHITRLNKEPIPSTRPNRELAPSTRPDWNLVNKTIKRVNTEISLRNLGEKTLNQRSSIKIIIPIK